MARKLSALAIIFVVFYLCAHYYIRWRNTVTDDVTKLSRLVDCDPADFRSIQIRQISEGKIQELKFERVDMPEPGLSPAMVAARWEWKYAEPDLGEADPVWMRRIASTICELYDPVPLRPDAFQPVREGTHYAVRLTATLGAEGLQGSGGLQKAEFDFGARAPDRTATLRYRSGSEERVVRISERFQQMASLPPEEFRNLRVMRLEADNVQRVSLKIGGKERFSMERTGADWKILRGGKELGQGMDGANRFLNRLASLKALGVEKLDYGSKECEGSKAKAVLELSAVGDRDETLRFDYGRSGEVSACSTARRTKFRVHHEIVRYLDVPASAVLTH
ncbi:MAG TPA: DUF4340 domain-containing protein [Bdellovibrionota bacterium]|jgi:hypothetical protein